MRLGRKPKAALFDLDGVLLDTEPLYSQATRSILQPFGKEYGWDLKSRVMGTDARHGAGVIIDALGLPLSVDEYLRRRCDALTQLFVDAPAMVGAEAFVALLRERRVPLAIASSSERSLCELKWSKHAWLRAFDIVICGDDAGIERLKPAPDIYLEAARRVGVPAAHCLVFEDSPAGVSAARAAGMQVIAIKAAELDPSLVRHADWVVSSYRELSPEACGFG